MAAEATAGFQGVSREGFLLMHDKIETQKGENRILRQKLQSKAEALLILSRELDKVRTECDDYRELTQTLQTKYTSLKLGTLPTPVGAATTAGADDCQTFNSRSSRDSSVAKRFAELRAENKRLAGEREKLRRVLKDREEDVRLVRGQLRLKEAADGDRDSRVGDNDHLVRRLEALQLKYFHRKQDLQSLLDEKEDLVQERDSYKCKVHRLNHAMNALLKNDGFKAVDLDWILAESRRLQESLAQLQEEKGLANEMGKRYKAALQGSSRAKLPSSEGSGGGGASLEDELLGLIRRTSFPCPASFNLRDAGSLQELCLSLLETLSDRMLQLKHQRAANGHLLAKMRTLEEKLLVTEHGELLLRPSQYLMQGYSAASVDEEGPPAEEMELVQREEQQEEVCGHNNPPDIIVQGVPRASVDEWHQEMEDKEGLEETIVLPDHLQLLVDQAMKSLLEQTQ